VIRRGRPEDADAIAEIWNAVIRDTTHTFGTVEKTPGELAAQIGAQPWFVAETAGAVLGFVTWGQFRGGTGYVHTVEHSVHVAEAGRGRGIGRALMAQAEVAARAGGIQAMIAGVAGENTGGAAFHAALGFREVGRLPQVGWKFGRWHDLVLMQKLL
jgi:L-amino acid N-acyltransferase